MLKRVRERASKRHRNGSGSKRSCRYFAGIGLRLPASHGNEEGHDLRGPSAGPASAERGRGGRFSASGRVNRLKVLEAPCC